MTYAGRNIIDFSFVCVWDTLGIPVTGRTELLFLSPI